MSGVRPSFQSEFTAFSPGYTSSDCSIAVARTPKVYSLLNGGQCDVVYNDCSKVVVIGDGFMESHQLTCNIIPMFVSRFAFKHRIDTL